MFKLYQVVTVFPAAVRALSSMTPSPMTALAPTPILYDNFSNGTVTISPRETLTLTVLPLPKTTAVLSANGTAATSAETTCDETSVFTITTSVGYSDVLQMSKGGSMSFGPSPLSSATPATSPGRKLDAITTFGNTVANGGSSTSVLTTGQNMTAPINTPTTEPGSKAVVTATSTIRLTSTVTVVVATETAGDPSTSDLIPSAINGSNKAHSTTTTDDPFPEPFATMPPNVPPYVELTTSKSPGIKSPVTYPAVSSNATDSPTKGTNVVTETSVVTLTEVHSTTTKMVTVCRSSTCEPPAPLETSRGKPMGNEANGANGVFAAQTADITGPLPTVYKPVYNPNTLRTLSMSTGTRTTAAESETQSTTDDGPTFWPTVFPSVANRAYMGYAWVLIGLVIALMLV